MVEGTTGAFGDGLMMGLLEDAAVAGANSGQRVNFGKLTFGAMVFTEWVNSQPVEITQAKYLELDESERSMDVVVNIDIREFNDALDFTYTRKVRVNGADWYAHWHVGIIEVYGLEEKVTDEDLSKKDRAIAIGKLVARKMYELDGKYVEMMDADQVKRKNWKAGDKTYYTPQLVQVFESRSACVAAYNERFNKNVDAASVDSDVEASAPEGFGSFAEFAEAVAMLKDESLTKKEVAEQLGVKLIEVLKVY